MLPSISVALVFLLAVTVSAQSEQPTAKHEVLDCKGPQHRELDFWIGEWDVAHRADGKKAGTSKVEALLDGCVILENWSGVDGFNGKSFNLYDRRMKRWIQKWVDSRGQLLEFEGEYREGRMELRGEQGGETGEPVQLKMTFVRLPDGRVQQLWEQSTDGGRKWHLQFDGIYTRR